MIKRKNICIPQLITYLISIAIFILAILFSTIFSYPFEDWEPLSFLKISIILFIYLISLFILQIYYKKSMNKSIIENVFILIISTLVLFLVLKFLVYLFDVSLSPLLAIPIFFFQLAFIITQRYVIKKITEIFKSSDPTMLSLYSIPILIILFSAILFVHNGAHSWSDFSRMATVQSVVENKTLIISDLDFGRTGDKVFVNGNFYSDKLITSVIPGIIIYWFLFKAGIVLSFGSNLAYQIITLFTMKLFWVAGLAAFYKILRKVSIKEIQRWILIFTLGFGSTYLSYSTVYNNHLLTASFLIIAFYFYLNAVELKNISLHLILSGFFFSLSGAGDMPSAIFFVCFLSLILLNKDLRSKSLFFIFPVIVTVLPTLYLNYQISGSILPFTMNLEYFNYPGSMWENRMDSLSGMAMNDIGFFFVYTFRMLFGIKGFIIYHPYLLFAIPLMITEITKSRQFKKEAIAISIGSIIMMLYYFLFTNNFGGDSFGIRWFVALLPFIIFFMYSYFQNPNKKLNMVLFASISFAVFVAIIGSVYTWGNIMAP